MNVLSLFDGMSCGQIALKELGIEPDIYYASEIDKFAIKQTQLNFPDTIQLGDVRNIKVADLEKIDLILGGSPCYNLSMIGKREGLSTKENVERARLQTIPEWYKWECSATQQCRMLGNGWTVDVIVHILSHMKMNEIE